MKVTLQGVSARHPAARAGLPPALHQLGLEIAAGEQLAVIGPSGAGKTTLLHLLACAIPPSTGTIELDSDGKSVSISADIVPGATGDMVATRNMTCAGISGNSLPRQ